jgi:hypothetical protein
MLIAYYFTKEKVPCRPVRMIPVKSILSQEGMSLKSGRVFGYYYPCTAGIKITPGPFILEQ